MNIQSCRQFVWTKRIVWLCVFSRSSLLQWGANAQNVSYTSNPTCAKHTISTFVDQTRIQHTHHAEKKFFSKLVSLRVSCTQYLKQPWEIKCFTQRQQFSYNFFEIKNWVRDETMKLLFIVYLDFVQSTRRIKQKDTSPLQWRQVYRSDLSNDSIPFGILEWVRMGKLDCYTFCFLNWNCTDHYDVAEIEGKSVTDHQ